MYAYTSYNMAKIKIHVLVKECYCSRCPWNITGGYEYKIKSSIVA